VPVITLSGNSHVSRVGKSILSNIGLSDLVSESTDQYLEIAINLSKDLNRLQSLRKNCRHMMSHSPLMDTKRFIFNLENCFYNLWKIWCNQ
jgi:protein O-GlcNAc transferase